MTLNPPPTAPARRHADRPAGTPPPNALSRNQLKLLREASRAEALSLEMASRGRAASARVWAGVAIAQQRALRDSVIRDSAAGTGEGAVT